MTAKDLLERFRAAYSEHGGKTRLLVIEFFGDKLSLPGAWHKGLFPGDGPMTQHFLGAYNFGNKSVSFELRYRVGNKNTAEMFTKLASDGGAWALAEQRYSGGYLQNGVSIWLELLHGTLNGGGAERVTREHENVQAAFLYEPFAASILLVQRLNQAPGWNGGGVYPETIGDLAKWFATRVAEYRNFPNQPHYWRVVKHLDAGDMTYTRREPHPRYVRTRKNAALRTAKNVHRWLEHEGIIGQPDWPDDLDDWDAIEPELSKLLNFVRKLSHSEREPQNVEPTEEKKSGRPKAKRGRPKGKVKRDLAADRDLVDRWKRAKETGTDRPDFCSDGKLNGRGKKISIAELGAAQRNVNRHK